VRSPGINVDPQAVDYFDRTTHNLRSFRALQNLSYVVGGRVLVSLGIGGVSEGFVPGGVHRHVPPGGSPVFDASQFNQTFFVLGAVGATVGVFLSAQGALRFYRDTNAINHNRAVAAATASCMGALMVAGGGVYYTYATMHRNKAGQWGMIALRAVGNGLIFGAIPNSFCSSEIVWGDSPIKHRIATRDGCFALGGALFLLWGAMSAPTPGAPLGAREVVQCLAIACLAVAGALPRTDMTRAQAAERIAARRRRRSSNISPSNAG
jgi:hypothetical protein